MFFVCLFVGLFVRLLDFVTALFCVNVEWLILPDESPQKVTITAKRNYDKTVLDERTDEYTD